MVSGVQTATTRVNEDGIKILFNCPRRDLTQRAKSRGGTPVTHAHIKVAEHSFAGGQRKRA